MAKLPWTDDEVITLMKLREGGATRRECAETLGRSYNSVTNKIQSMGAGKTEGRNSEETFAHTTKGDTASIHSVSDRIRTPQDAMEYAEIDPVIWEIERQTVNSWESAAKTPDGIERITLWQIKLQLKRRASALITDGLKTLFDRMATHKPASPKAGKPSTDNPHLLEVSLFDAHFGKLCWYPGQDFDTKVAEKIYLGAVDELITKTANWNIEEVLFPVGQDFFHVDNWKNTTAKGTVMDVDAPFQQVFEAGAMAVVHAIDRCLSLAPVKILWVPGNHDPSTSWYLLRFLDAWYRSNDHVEIDTDPRPRKYIHYGVNLIGFTHGDQEQHRDLPAIMAGEVPQLWAKSTWREIHTGHFHRAKQIVVKHTDEFGGVRVRVLPSLSGVDAWHYQKGYVNNRRAAEAYLWNKADGYAGHFSANARA